MFLSDHEGARRRTEEKPFLAFVNREGREGKAFQYYPFASFAVENNPIHDPFVSE